MSIGNEEEYTDAFDPIEDLKEAAALMVLKDCSRAEACEKVRQLNQDRAAHDQENCYRDPDDPIVYLDESLTPLKVPPEKRSKVEAIAQELLRDGYGSEFC